MKTFDATHYDGNPTEIKLAFTQWAWDNRVFSDDTIKITYGTSDDEFMVVTEEQYLLELAEAILEEKSVTPVMQTPLQIAIAQIQLMSTEDIFSLQEFVDGYIEHLCSQAESQMESC